MNKERIHRWVTMDFEPEKVGEFLQVFEQSKLHIRQFQGCLSLQLVQDPLNETMISTSSIWESESHLNEYRQSTLFKDTWAKTKPLFRNKAQAKTFKLLEWIP